MKRMMVVTLVVFALFALVVSPVLAAPLSQESSPDILAGLAAVLGTIMNFLTVFGTLAGVAALVSVLVDVGKRIGLVQDGQAPTASALLNAVFFVIIVALGFFTKITPEQFDQFAASVSTVLLAVLGFVFQIRATATVHKELTKTNVPLLQFSHSPKS